MKRPMVFKMLVGLMAVVFMICIGAVPAMAMTTEEAVQALTAYDEHITVGDNGMVYYTVSTYDEFRELILQSVNAVFRASSAAELTEFKYTTTDDGGFIYKVSAEQIAALAEEDDYVDAWVDGRMQDIIPDGTGINDALRTITEYVKNNFAYNRSISYSGDVDADRAYQGAAEMLRTGSGLCASYSHVFRSMVEGIPVNADGVVDWENGENHLTVALVAEENVINHEWTAIQNPDGTWTHYDTTWYSTGCAYDKICGVSTAQICAFYGVAEDTLVWYY